MDYYPQNSLYPAASTERGQLSPGEMFTLLRDHVWEVLATTAIVFALALAYLLIATPIYSADVLVRVNPSEPNALGIALQNQETLSPPAPSPVTEMAVMLSRSVLEPVIERYRFDVTVTPHTIPLLGAIAEKFATRGTPAAPWLPFKSFAWGGESVQIGTLDVPKDLEEEKLTLTAVGGGAYDLRGPSNQVLVSGNVGIRAMGHDVTVLVNELTAQPGTEFEVVRWNSLDAVKRFNNMVKVTDKVKDSGLIQIEYADKDPVKAAEVANALGQQYLASAVASRQANDTKTLAFINGELPACFRMSESPRQRSKTSEPNSGPCNRLRRHRPTSRAASTWINKLRAFRSSARNFWNASDRIAGGLRLLTHSSRN